MSTPTGDDFSFPDFESVVEAELAMVESSDAARAAALPASQWLPETADAQRDEAELRSLLGAAKALEGD